MQELREARKERAVSGEKQFSSSLRLGATRQYKLKTGKGREKARKLLVNETKGHHCFWTFLGGKAFTGWTVLSQHNIHSPTHQHINPYRRFDLVEKQERRADVYNTQQDACHIISQQTQLLLISSQKLYQNFRNQMVHSLKRRTNYRSPKYTWR